MKKELDRTRIAAYFGWGASVVLALALGGVVLPLEAAP